MHDFAISQVNHFNEVETTQTNRLGAEDRPRDSAWKCYRSNALLLFLRMMKETMDLIEAAALLDLRKLKKIVLLNL